MVIARSPDSAVSSSAGPMARPWLSASSENSVTSSSNVEPAEALASAGSTLLELVTLFSELAESQGLAIGPAEDETALSGDLAITIEELNLSVRSYNCLKREGINTVGDLVQRSEAELMDI